MTISKRWDVFLVAGIFISLICIFYANVIFFDEMFVKRDIGRYYHPLRFLTRQIFLSGGFPFWNPYLFCGIPLFATIQSCVLYPVSLICYLGDFSHMFNIFILFHIFLAGLFMYLLMKSWGLSKLASFFAAFTFMFSGYMISAINLTISLCSAAWFPLLVYCYRKTRINTEKKHGLHGLKWTVFSTLTLVMMLLAGDPAIVYISIVVLFAISGYFFLENLAERGLLRRPAEAGILAMPAFGRHFKPFFLTLILFLLLSAFQTVPFLEFLRLTDRKNMPWWTASGWSVPLTDLISLVVPFFNDINWYYGDYWQVQSWLDNYYMGVIPLCLCFIGAFFDKSKKTNLLILFSVFSLALSLGGYTLFYPILYNLLPFFRFIRYPVRFFFLFAFCIAALSGIGLDWFRNNVKTDERVRRLSKGMLIFSFLTAVVLAAMVLFSDKIFVKIWNALFPLVMDTDPAKNPGDFYIYTFMAFYNSKRALALFLAFGALFFLGTKKGIRTGSLCLALVGIALSDIVATNLKYEPSMDIKTYIAPTENIKFLKKDNAFFRIAVSPAIGRLHTRLPEKTYAEGVLAAKDRLTSNRMVEYGIYDISGYDSMYLKRQNRLLGVIVGLKDPGETQILDMLNVKYICTGKGSPEKKGFRLVNETKTAYLYENLTWLPRAYLAGKAVVIKDEEKIMEKLKDKTWEPREEVILEEEIASSVLTSKMSTPPRNDAVEVSIYKPNEVIIKATVTSPKFLVLADSYYPGWKVYVDGKRDKIYRANYILRAVYLREPGEHIVRFAYDPFSFKLGAGLTLLGTVLCAVTICGLRTVPKQPICGLRTVPKQ